MIGMALSHFSLVLVWLLWCSVSVVAYSETQSFQNAQKEKDQRSESGLLSSI